MTMFAALHESGSGTTVTNGHACSNDPLGAKRSRYAQFEPFRFSNLSGFGPLRTSAVRKACIVLAPPIGGWDAPAIARSRFAGDAARYRREVIE